MSFWKKVKGFFGGGGGDEPPEGLTGHDPKVAAEVIAVLRVRCAAQTSFEAVDIADEVTRDDASRGVAQIRAACAIVEALYESG